MLVILVNSTSTKEETKEITSDIAGVIEEQIGGVTNEQVELTGPQRVMISKIGHFLEYTLFALLLSLSVAVWGGNLFQIVFQVLFCTVFLALTDEQIQFLALDRGSRVSDVIIDLAGGFTGYGLALVSNYLWKRRKER